MNDIRIKNTGRKVYYRSITSYNRMVRRIASIYGTKPNEVGIRKITRCYSADDRPLKQIRFVIGNETALRTIVF